MPADAPSMTGMSVEEAFILLNAHPEQKVWAYMRVSSKGQEDDGYGFEAQADAVAAWAIAEKTTVMGLREMASASKPLVKTSLVPARAGDPEEAPRPVLQALLAHLCKLEGGTLLLYKLDRLSRVAADQDLILEVLRRREVRVVSLQEGEAALLTGNDPTRDLMRRILGAFAQYEKAIITMRTENGRRAKASRGGYVGGRPPFGYRASVDGELHVAPEEAKQVRAVYFWRHMEDRSYWDIIGQLNKCGCIDWKPMRISRVLQNRPLYSGIYIDPYGKPHNRPDLRIIPDVLENLPNPVEELKS